MEARKTTKLTDRRAQAAIRDLRKIRAELALLAERAKERERTIKAAMGDAEEAYVGAIKVATYTTAIRQSISQTHLKKRAQDDPAVRALLDECTVLSEVRTFKLVDPE